MSADRPLGTVTADLARPARALAVGAHPDDIEDGCGATLAKWAAGGAEVFELVLTDGSKGSWDPERDVRQLTATRRAEQRAAAVQLGSRHQVVFLDRPDGELEATLEVRAALCHWVRTIRPDVVLGHDPWRRYRLHPDHRAAGFLVVDAVAAARNPLTFPRAGEAAHRVGCLLLWEADQPDHVEDVVGFAEAKARALFAHRSQYPVPAGDRGAGREAAALRERVADRLARDGVAFAVAAGEVFKRIDLPQTRPTPG